MASLATFTIKIKDLVSNQLAKIDSNLKVTTKGFSSANSSIGKSTYGIAKGILRIPRIKTPTKRARKEIDKLEKKAQSLDKNGGKSINNFKSKARGLNSLGRAFKGKGFSSIGSSLKFAGAGLNPITTGIGLAAIGAYKLGQAVSDASIKMQNNLEITSQFMKASEAETKGLTAQATALSKVYGGDYTETVKTAALLSKKFGISNAKAFDIIKEGYATGANLGGDFLKTIEGSAEAFKSLGLSARQQMAIMQQTTSNGIKNAPKLLKAFNSNLPNLGGDVKRLLDQNFGSNFTTGLKERIANGETSIIEALGSISQAVNQTTLANGAAQNLAYQIFGDNSDNAVQFLNNFKSYETNLDRIVSKNSTFNRVKLRQFSLEKQIANSQLKSSKRIQGMNNQVKLLGLRIKATFYNNLGGILDFVDTVKRFGISLYNLSERLGIVKLGMGYLKTMYNGLAGLLNIATKGMDYISNKIGGPKLATQEEREGFKKRGLMKGSSYISPLNLSLNKKNSLVLASSNLNKATSTLSKINRNNNQEKAFKALHSENKGLSNKAQSQLSGGINSITTGGSQVRNITVNVDKMNAIETLNSTIDEAKDNAGDKLLEVLVKVLQGSETALNRG